MTHSRARILEAAVLAGAFLGAVLLTVAELTTLYAIHVASRHAPITSEATGSHNGYAMVPIAALALVLAAGTWNRKARTRPLALLAIAVLGVGALVLALADDLPDAQSQGLVLFHGTYHIAKATPSAGLYMETLGAIVLIITGGCGVLLAGPAAPSDRGRPQQRREPTRRSPPGRRPSNG